MKRIDDRAFSSYSRPESGANNEPIVVSGFYTLGEDTAFRVIERGSAVIISYSSRAATLDDMTGMTYPDRQWAIGKRKIEFSVRTPEALNVAHRLVRKIRERR